MGPTVALTASVAGAGVEPASPAYGAGLGPGYHSRYPAAIIVADRGEAGRGAARCRAHTGSPDAAGRRRSRRSSRSASAAASGDGAATGGSPALALLPSTPLVLERLGVLVVVPADLGAVVRGRRPGLDLGPVAGARLRSQR